jgi:hypothetical protein
MYIVDFGQLGTAGTYPHCINRPQKRKKKLKRTEVSR